MAKPKRASVAALIDSKIAYARVLDRRPEFAELVHGIVGEQLENGPHVEEKDPWRHVALHLVDIFPMVMTDSAVQEKLPEIVAEYENLPSTAEMRINDDLDSEDGFGSLGVGTAIVAECVFKEIVDYCMGAATMAEGTSAEVPHLWPFC